MAERGIKGIDEGKLAEDLVKALDQVRRVVATSPDLKDEWIRGFVEEFRPRLLNAYRANQEIDKMPSAASSRRRYARELQEMDDALLAMARKAAGSGMSESELLELDDKALRRFAQELDAQNFVDAQPGITMPDMGVDLGIGVWPGVNRTWDTGEFSEAWKLEGNQDMRRAAEKEGVFGRGVMGL